MEKEKIEFLAYLPPIQTALTISGDGDLLRIKLDCNLKISPEAARLLMMTGKRLKITVEEYFTELDGTAGENGEQITEGANRSAATVDSRRIALRRDQRKGG